MNGPNLLTLSRVMLAIFLVFSLEQGTFMGNMLALIVFILASLTDFYDGFLAKRLGIVSNFGKIMDPIADKILVLSTFGVLANVGMIAWWMFMVIAVREILVTAWRLYAMVRHGQVLAAERSGKIKTVAQMTAIFFILFYLVAAQSDFCSSWFYQVQWILFSLIYALMWVAVVLTVYSGIEYFRSKAAIKSP